VTAYWDKWALLVERQTPEVKEAISWLIQCLHEYDHSHGGHLLDSYLENNELLNMLIRRASEPNV